MRLIYLLLVLCCLSALHLHGQDLIITASNDSINCNIRKEKNGFIHYKTWDDLRTVKYVSKDTVLSFVRDYYRDKYRPEIDSTEVNPQLQFGVNNIPLATFELGKKEQTEEPGSEKNATEEEATDKAEPSTGNKKRSIPVSTETEYVSPSTFQDPEYVSSEKPNSKSIRYYPAMLSANYGLGVAGGRIPENLAPILQEHMKQLKTGGSLGLHAHIFWNDWHGIALKFTHFHSTFTTDNLGILNTSTNVLTVGSLTDRISISHFGVGYTGRWIFAKTTAFEMDWHITAGYTSYFGSSSFANEKFTSQGEAFAINFAVHGHYFLNPTTSIGLGIETQGGSLAKEKITLPTGETVTYEPEPEDRTSVGRLIFVAGLRWHIGRMPFAVQR